MSADKLRITPLSKWIVPLGSQEIELQQVDYLVGGMSLLRTRIREGRRFTVFDVDPQTARRWGEALLSWADGQPSGQRDEPPPRTVAGGRGE